MPVRWEQASLRRLQKPVCRQVIRLGAGNGNKRSSPHKGKPGERAGKRTEVTAGDRCRFQPYFLAELREAGDADFVIEAIAENKEAKAELFDTLDKICPPHAVLASNTSSLPITELAAATKRPEKVIGMHFMNPVPVMELVEVIRGLATSEETAETVKKLAVRMNKTPVEVNDFRALYLIAY